jgi:hypothetical protein
MINFNKRLERTYRQIWYDSIFDNRKFLINSNKDFLCGKSLLEFGVWSGASLTQFSNLYDEYGLEKKFFGFDSFEGLPPEELDENNPEYWKPGLFSDTSLEEIQKKLPFVNLKKGWFKDTLNDQTLKEVSKTKVGIFHIDCDIYTSTIQVLEWIAKNNLLVSGSLVIYDDWGGHYQKGVGEFECGEGKAHKEICEKYNLNFDFITCDVIIPEYYEICVFKYNAN